MPRINQESDILAAESVSFNLSPRAVKIRTRRPMFVSQKWHRLYAGALMETDSVRLSLFILVTEEAIFARYIELIADDCKSDEIADLQNAIAVLSELRESNLIDYVAPEFVA
jgi:hypothetical protein